MRVIVTGSRDWPWPEPVWDELFTLAWWCKEREEDFRVYMGDCPSGPDDYADKWVENHGPMVKDFRMFFADWDKHGKAAGPIRNREMIDYVKGMEMDDEVICLAYRLNGSRGTTDCMDRAYKAGFEVRSWDLSRRVGRKP